MKRALKEDPDFLLAQGNLEDLRLPVGERSGPWPFTVADWIPRALILAFADRLEAAERSRGKKEAPYTPAAFLEQHPGIVQVVPRLLERGDPGGREFALEFISQLRTRELLEALKTFALGQNGPDALRAQAATLLMQEGLLEPGPTTLWVEGQPRELLLTSFEIYEEPEPSRHSRRVQELMAEAMDAMHARDAGRSMTLLEEALQLEPGAPDIRNNLAAAYAAEGRTEDYRRIIQELYAQHPDYFFARINMANLRLQEEDADQAQELIQPLLARQRLHVSELRALCMVEIRIALERKDSQAAQHWLDMWTDVEPDSEQAQEWERMIDLLRLTESISLRRRRKKT